MPPQRILFADNHKSFHRQRVQFLEPRYKVLKAYSVTEAEQYLRDEWVHVAILDIRLTDDNDERDISGLVLAKNPAYLSIPKIMQTSFPSYQQVREALGPALQRLPPAVDFIAKAEGPDALLQAVERAFATHVRINWDLVIRTNERTPVTFPYLASRIDPSLIGETLLQRAEELEDLLRRLFYTKSQLTIDRVLWQRNGRVALTILTFKDDGLPESFIVVCGGNADITRESLSYREWAPKGSETTTSALNSTAETTHFAANAYVLANAEVERLHSLFDLYRSGTDKPLETAIQSLFHKTLSPWQERHRLAETQSFVDLFRERLDWLPEEDFSAAFNERINALLHQMPLLMNVKMHRTHEQLAVNFYRQAFSYPDPLSLLAGPPDVGQAFRLASTPGFLAGENVLVDDNGRAWLTDFADAGLAPEVWNFVSLEAAIRFDWLEVRQLDWLHEMEQCLTAGSFTKFDVSAIEPALRKAARAIQAVRQCASTIPNNDPLLYHLGLLVHAAHRLMRFNPSVNLQETALVRFAHILLAASMICGRITEEQRQGSAKTIPLTRGIRIDEENNLVLVDGHRVALTPQQYRLLRYLYTNQHKVNGRAEIFRQIFGQAYNEQRESSTRLHVAIRRLREKIEDNPSHPRYLREENGGYRLVLQPKGERT